MKTMKEATDALLALMAKSKYTIRSYSALTGIMGKSIVEHSSDDYQGDTWVLLEDDGGKLGYIKYGWGSCSGCDAMQACDTNEEVMELFTSLYNRVQWFDSRDEAEKYFANHDWEGDYCWSSEHFQKWLTDCCKHLGIPKPKGKPKPGACPDCYVVPDDKDFICDNDNEMSSETCPGYHVVKSLHEQISGLVEKHETAVSEQKLREVVMQKPKMVPLAKLEMFAWACTFINYGSREDTFLESAAIAIREQIIDGMDRDSVPLSIKPFWTELERLEEERVGMSDVIKELSYGLRNESPAVRKVLERTISDLKKQMEDIVCRKNGTMQRIMQTLVSI
jgi:hypothetical protein